MYKYISDIITSDQIKSWSNDEIIFISSPTGSGKTSFIIEKLANIDEDKKILILVHRNQIKEQFKNYIKSNKKRKQIYVETYQSLENNLNYSLDAYDYIICDECHYFTSDTKFNINTELSLNNILKSNSIKIMMSATGKIINRYLKVNDYKVKDIKISFEIPNDIKIYFYDYDETVNNIFNEVLNDPNSKAIYFVESAKKGYKFHLNYERKSIFNCSKTHQNYNKYVNSYSKKEIQKINELEKFDSKILITTTTMDAGISISDPKVNTMVIDIHDYEVLMQCIGRKRFKKDNNKLNIFIKNMTPKELRPYFQNYESIVEEKLFFENNNAEQYLSEYGRTHHSKVIYDIPYSNTNIIGEDSLYKKKINQLVYIQSHIFVKDLKPLMDKKLDYKQFILDKFNEYDLHISSSEYELKSIDTNLYRGLLIDYLNDNDYINKPLYNDVKMEITNFIRSNIRLEKEYIRKETKSIQYSTLNNIFKELNINYIAKREKVSNRWVWIIEKVKD